MDSQHSLSTSQQRSTSDKSAEELDQGRIRKMEVVVPRTTTPRIDEPTKKDADISNSDSLVAKDETFEEHQERGISPSANRDEALETVPTNHSSYASGESKLMPNNETSTALEGGALNHKVLEPEFRKSLLKNGWAHPEDWFKPASEIPMLTGRWSGMAERMKRKLREIKGPDQPLLAAEREVKMKKLLEDWKKLDHELMLAGLEEP